MRHPSRHDAGTAHDEQLAGGDGPGPRLYLQGQMRAKGQPGPATVRLLHSSWLRVGAGVAHPGWHSMRCDLGDRRTRRFNFAALTNSPNSLAVFRRRCDLERSANGVVRHTVPPVHARGRFVEDANEPLRRPAHFDPVVERSPDVQQVSLLR